MGLCITDPDTCFVGVPVDDLDKKAGRHELDVPLTVAGGCECADDAGEDGRTEFPQSAHIMLIVCCG